MFWQRRTFQVFLESGLIQSYKTFPYAQFVLQHPGTSCPFRHCLTFATHGQRIPQAFWRKCKKIESAGTKPAPVLMRCGISVRRQYETCSANLRNGELRV